MPGSRPSGLPSSGKGSTSWPASSPSCRAQATPSTASRTASTRPDIRRCPSRPTTPPKEDGAESLEPVASLTERALAEGEDLRRRDRIDDGLNITVRVLKGVSPDFEAPAPVPLRRPRFGQACESPAFGDANGVSLDDDVEPAVPVVATRREAHLRVVREVDRLLLGRARAEMERLVQQTATRGVTCGRPS